MSSGEPSDEALPFPHHSGAWAVDPTARPSPEGGEPARYQREHRLGRGGMGEVWQARDRLLRRTVALKSARPELGEDAARRLVREARITASLDHPGIVPVYDVGEHADGQPWFAMRAVRGRPLGALVEEAETPADRLALVPVVLQACEAVAHAHAAGIVHRDLKPDNVVVGPHGEVVVLDWGLARVPDEDPAWSAVLSRFGTPTRAGLALGTPAYMSPEQARARPVTPASDVWALGLLLYTCLSGRQAYPGPSAEQLLAQVLAGPPPPLTELAPEVPAELASVVERALRHDSADRYPDAAALAADLRAWVQRQRVGAHRYSVRDELLRQLRRRRGALGVAVVGVVALAVVALVGAVRLQQERAQLVAAEQRLGAALGRADANLSLALVAQAQAAVDRESWGLAEVLAARALTLSDTPAARGLLAGARSAARPRLMERWPVGACGQAVLAADRVFCLAGGLLEARRLDGTVLWRTHTAAEALHADHAGSVLLLDTEGEVVRVDPADGRLVSTPARVSPPQRAGQSLVPGEVLALHSGLAGEWVTVGPDAGQTHASPCAGGARFYVLAVDAAGQPVALCEDGSLQTGTTRHVLDPPVEYPWRLVLSPDGRTAAVGTMFGEVVVVSLADGRQLRRLSLGEAMVGALEFGPDGRWLGVDVPGVGTRLIELRTGVTHALPRPAARLSFSAPGQVDVLVGAVLERWALPPVGPVAAVAVPGGVVDLDWTARGFVYAAGNGVGRLDLDTGRVTARVFDHAGTKAAALRPDGSVLVAGLQRSYRWGADDQLTALPATKLGSRRLVPLSEDRLLMPIDSDLFTLDAAGEVVAGRTVRGLKVVDAAASPDGRHAAIYARDGRLVRLDATTGALRSLGRRTLRGLAIGPGGWPVYLAGDGGVEALHEDGTTTRLLATDAPIRTLALSPDGRWLAAVDRERVVRLVERETGVVRARMRSHTRHVDDLAFSPDGTTLATGSWDGTIRFWDLTVLAAEPAALLEQAEQRWGTTAEDVLAGGP